MDAGSKYLRSVHTRGDVTPELLAFAVVVLGLGAPGLVALAMSFRTRRDVKLALLRLRILRRRERARVRAVFSRPPPRPIGFLSHLVTRDSDPPSSALVHVLPAREAVVHVPLPSDDTRGIVPPRCGSK